MRILFILKGLGLVRHFEEVVERIVETGHTVSLAQAKPPRRPVSLPARLAALDGCRVVTAAAGRDDGLKGSLGILRQLRDYVRYHEPPLWEATANRRRALARLIGTISEDTMSLPEDTPDAVLRLNDRAVARLRGTFRQLEAVIPADENYLRFLRGQRPDLLLVTPLVNFGGRQAEYVKAARALGIPSAVLVFSWDNLTNKGLMHEVPDRVFVWNEVQRREAIELHGVAPDAVIATGAPRFDPFYRLRPSQDRDALCRTHGLDPGRPLVVYLASSPHVAPEEPRFARRWLDALRAAPRVREVQVLVRPHPRHRAVWTDFPPAGAPDAGVAVMAAKSVQTDQSLYDVLTHADAAIGLNTSAELEAGILGTPVYTIDAGDQAPGQGGSSHFRYLLAREGGFVEEAATLDEHVSQLARGLEGRGDTERQRRFIEAFVRPRSADRPVSPLLADELMAFAASRARNQPSFGLWSRARDAIGGAARRRSPDAPPPAAPTAPATPVAPGPETAETEGPVKRRIVYQGRKLHILVSSEAERRWRLDPGRKEPWTVAWLDEQVGPGDILYDIGANVGVFSLIGAANLEDRGCVVAVEPSSSTFARLCENIRLNRFTGLIIPVPLPLSDEVGLQAFRYHSLVPGGSRHTLQSGAWTPEGARGRTQPMLAMTLDRLVADFGLPRPTLMKVDVDGVEDRLLAGAGSVLNDPAFRSLLIEVDPECEAGVLAALDAAGLQLVARHGRPGQRVWYGIFARQP